MERDAYSMTTSNEKLESALEEIIDQLRKKVNEIHLNGFTMDKIYFGLCYTEFIFEWMMFKWFKDMDPEERNRALGGKTIEDYQDEIKKLVLKKLEIDVKNGLDSFIPAAGIKITNRGEWLPHKWNVRKGYLKIHVAVDIKKRHFASSSPNSR